LRGFADFLNLIIIQTMTANRISETVAIGIAIELEDSTITEEIAPTASMETG